jgi:hypothetical protein
MGLKTCEIAYLTYITVNHVEGETESCLVTSAKENTAIVRE